GLERGEQRVGRHHLAPRVGREQRLRRSGGARVEGHRLVHHRVHEEERHLDGDLELVPLGVRQREVGVEEVALRYGGELPAARPAFGEEEVAGAAGAHEGPALHVHDVGVLLGDRLVAQLAALAGGGGRRLLEKLGDSGREGLVGAVGPDKAAEPPRRARVFGSGHAAPPAAGLRPISAGIRPAGAWRVRPISTATGPGSAGGGMAMPASTATISGAASRIAFSRAARATSRGALPQPPTVSSQWAPPSSMPSRATLVAPSWGRTPSMASWTRSPTGIGWMPWRMKRLASRSSWARRRKMPSPEGCRPTRSRIRPSPAPYNSTSKL